jgi:hypothetical protein
MGNENQGMKETIYIVSKVLKKIEDKNLALKNVQK